MHATRRVTGDSLKNMPDLATIGCQEESMKIGRVHEQSASCNGVLALPSDFS
jgi:hypothetical protein